MRSLLGVFRFGLAVLLAQVFSASAVGKLDFAQALSVLRRGIEDGAFPGCTVVIGTDEAVLWSGAFGFQDYTNRIRVTPATVYDLASLTKVVGTTSVFMRFAALGKLNLSAPVSQYLPEFIATAPSPEERVRRKRVTLEHLLTHSAGLAAWKPFYRTVHSYTGMLQTIYAAPLESTPGERYRYSDLGMILAGEVASRIGAKPLPEVERELVFDPLGMKDTLRCPPGKLARRIPPTEVETATGMAVHGVVHDENARAAEGITGHAGLFATAEDLGKLAREHLRACDGRSRLFPPEVVKEFLCSRAIGDSSWRAIGWGVGRDEAGKPTGLRTHTGFTGTYFQLDLDRKRFVVLLTNRVHPTRENNKIGRIRRKFLEAVDQQFGSKSEQ